MAKPTTWIAGLAGSVLIHAAGFGLFSISNTLDDPPDQTGPQTKLELDTVAAETQDATAQTPDADDAESAQADSTAVGAGAIRQSSAEAVQTSADVASALAPKTDEALDATQSVAQNADAVSAPSQKARTQQLNATQGQSEVVPSSTVQSGVLEQAAASALAAPNTIANSVTPDSATAPPSQATASTVQAAEPIVETAAASAQVANRVSASVPPPQTAVQSQVEPTSSLVSATPKAEQVASVSTPAQTTVASALDAAAVLPETATPNSVVASAGVPAIAASAGILETFEAANQVPDIGRADSATPTALPAAQSALQSDIAQQGDTQGSAAPSAEANAINPEQPPLPASTAKANLAWQFGDRLVTDPQALATIQAFMTPNTVEGADEVKDDLSNVLTDIECARLSATFIPETGSLEMRGHIPDPSLRDTILAEMQAQVGDGIPVTTNLLHLPAPQCGALTGIAGVGLPQSTDQFTNARLIGANAHAAEFPYTEGNMFQFEFTAPEYDAVVYVDYFDADGKVVHLQPNLTGITGIQKANSVVGVFPKQPGTNDPIVIGPPFGQEIAVAFAASEPLFSEPRPIIEDAAPYLSWLKDQVAAAKQRNPNFKGEWVYFFITTMPASQ